MFSLAASDSARILIASADVRLRSALMGAVSGYPGVKVVGFIRSNDQILTRTVVSSPEMLLLDAQLRLEDNLALFTELQRALPNLHIVVYDSGQDDCTAHESKAQLDSAPGLRLTWVQADSQDDFAKLRETLAAIFCPHAPVQTAVACKTAKPAAAQHLPERSVKRCKPEALVIGTSTGGPMALMSLVKMLPRDFPLPVAVVQHMPPSFTRTLAERLNQACDLEVVEGQNGMEFVSGRVIIAPGGFHLLLRGTPTRCRIELGLGEREHSCRPAANALFRSAAEVYRGNVLTVVLTGMGRDGFEGASQLRELGSRVIVQDAETSTVWGMPGALARAGLADAVLPLQEIASEVLRCL